MSGMSNARRPLRSIVMALIIFVVLLMTAACNDQNNAATGKNNQTSQHTPVPTPTEQPTEPPPTLSPLILKSIKVQGNRLVDESGATVKLRGAGRWSLDFSCAGDRHFTVSDFQAMTTWGFNTVRFPLAANFWLHGDGSCTAQQYQHRVDTAIQNAESMGLYVIIDLHRNVGGVKGKMPDENALAFWKNFLPKHHESPLLAEVFNEPHDVPWNVWLNGGTVDNTPVVGIQTLIKVVNDAAPTMPVLVEGLDWGYTMKSAPQIQGKNIVIDSHPYNFGPTTKQPGQWQSDFGFLSSKYPIVASEFGDPQLLKVQSSTYNTIVIDTFLQKYSGAVAWNWDTNAAHDKSNFFYLLNDWDGTPSSIGAPERAAFQANA